MQKPVCRAVVLHYPPALPAAVFIEAGTKIGATELAQSSDILKEPALDTAMSLDFKTLTISSKYGFISALILATSVEFIILARYAILDIVVSSLIGISVMCGFLTQFVEEKNKKYFWWLFYIFSA